MTLADSLQLLRRALMLLNNDSRRLPLFAYRVLIALTDAAEPLSAYQVARRAGFMLEHGRVKLHEALHLGIVEKLRDEEQGVVWRVTERGREELARIVQLMAEQEQTVPAVQKPARKPRRRKGAS